MSLYDPQLQHFITLDVVMDTLYKISVNYEYSSLSSFIIRRRWVLGDNKRC